MRRVLIVAYYFPPIAGIGSIRAASFAKYLPDHGWEATVLAPANTPHSGDPSLAVGQAPVVRTRSLEFSRRGQMSRGAAAADSAGPPQPVARSAPSRWPRRVAKQVVFPDAQIGWYPGAVAGGIRTLRGQRFDVIFSSAFPITSHLVAWTLKRRSTLPWVAEFRDPWSDDPAFRAVSAAARRVEQAIAAEADALVMPTPTWAAHFAERWSRTVDVLPNGFDPAPTPPAVESATLAHLGTYTPWQQGLPGLWQQDLRGLWEAVRRLRQNEAQAVGRIRFVGQLSSGARKELAASGLGDLISETGLMTQDDALRQIGASTVLVLAGSSQRGPIARGWVPAKIFEYLATDRPIIYLGETASDGAALVAGQPGCAVVEPSDVGGIMNALRSALRPASYRRQVDDLSRRSRAGELARILDAALREPVNRGR